MFSLLKFSLCEWLLIESSLVSPYHWRVTSYSFVCWIRFILVLLQTTLRSKDEFQRFATVRLVTKNALMNATGVRNLVLNAKEFCSTEYNEYWP